MPRYIPRPEVDAFLQANHKKMTIPEMAAKLHVCYSMLQYRMQKLGLEKLDGRQKRLKNKKTKKVENSVFFNVNERENWLL